VLSTLTAIATHNPEPPAGQEGQAGQALSDLIMQLLQKDPDRRPGSSQIVQDQLAAIQRREIARSESAETLPLFVAS
jgi:hypothetical protein